MYTLVMKLSQKKDLLVPWYAFDRAKLEDWLACYDRGVRCRGTKKKGQGVAKDTAKAIRLYRLASAQGQHHLELVFGEAGRRIDGVRWVSKNVQQAHT